MDTNSTSRDNAYKIGSTSEYFDGTNIEFYINLQNDNSDFHFGNRILFIANLIFQLVQEVDIKYLHKVVGVLKLINSLGD